MKPAYLSHLEWKGSSLYHELNFKCFSKYEWEKDKCILIFFFECTDTDWHTCRCRRPLLAVICTVTCLSPQTVQPTTTLRFPFTFIGSDSDLLLHDHFFLLRNKQYCLSYMTPSISKCWGKNAFFLFLCQHLTFKITTNHHYWGQR